MSGIKLSIVTAVYNREKTIGRAVSSVTDQNYGNVQHVIVDGNSTDRTLELVKKNIQQNSIIISEPDSGIYDALNKGIIASSGSVIGMLHSDDVFKSDTILSRVAELFEDEAIDYAYADAAFFKAENKDKIVRYYSSEGFSVEDLKTGNMPAHTTLFVRKKVFDELGLYRTDYRVSADFEFMIRLFSSNFKGKYIPELWVLMQTGGASTAGLKAKLKVNQEVLKACKEHNIKTGPLTLMRRYPKKILGMLRIKT